MTDLNNFNLQGFDQAQFQGDNTVLQQTAGLGGTTDENGLFGATTTTNDIFGQTLSKAGFSQYSLKEYFFYNRKNFVLVLLNYY